MKVQALDPETKHWLFATILEIENGRCKVSWTGYPKTYDCWVEWEEFRLPILKRAMLSRNAISKDNFKNRQDPKNLEKDDVIYDTVRKSLWLQRMTRLNLRYTICIYLGFYFMFILC